MKIEKLLVDIKRSNFNMEQELQVKKYLPMETKKVIAQGIMYECTSNESGVIKIDSVQRYMSYVKYMITTHTNLEYTDQNYDVLCSTMYGDKTLLNAIMDCFEADAKECSRILNLMSDDVAYNNSLTMMVGEFLYNLKSVLSDATNQLQGKINGINLDGLDIDGLNKFLKTIQ